MYDPSVLTGDLESLPLEIQQELMLIATSINLPAAANQSEFTNIESLVNSRGKNFGTQVWDMDNNRPLYAAGPNPNSDWVDAMGVVVYSPVQV